MICYKDKTFCPFYKECLKGQECDRALTEGVKESAKAWWGTEDAPISMFMDKPDCFEEKE